jgi:hypothetical protein
MVAWKFLARLKDREGLGLRFIMAKKKKKKQGNVIQMVMVVQ